MTVAEPGGRGGRTPGLLYAALTLLTVVLVAAGLLSVPRQAPPAVAEIAPQAVTQIKQAPPEQASKVGQGKVGGGQGPGGSGGGPSATPSASPTPLPSPKIVPRLHSRCVGNPPRQIEDPQSPPCVEFWEGDNGGATSRGVTKDTILIASPDTADQRLLDFFNSRFEFYGRKLVYAPNVAASDCDSAKQQAQAIQLASQGVFAVNNYAACEGAAFFGELARQKVIGVQFAPNYTEAQLQHYAPYIWQYPMAVDTIQKHIGQQVCTRFAGKLAVHAGTGPTSDLRTQKRVFAVVTSKQRPEMTIDPAPLIAQLRSCGVTPAVRITIDQETDANTNGQYDDAVQKFISNKVTSVICLCTYGGAGNLGAHASAAQYHPEWLTSTYWTDDYDFFLNQLPYWTADQRPHIVGLTVQPRQTRIALDPWYQAITEGDPTGAHGARTAYDDTAQTRENGDYFYHSLLLIASGIQMAGPNLTPQTFERALQQTVFPNPDTEAHEGKVGFAGGSHAMTTDAAEFWWNENAPSPYKGGAPSGSFCYVDSGRRRTLGGYPSGPDPFSGACDSGG